LLLKSCVEKTDFFACARKQKRKQYMLYNHMTPFHFLG
jgi:hypothetical protein